MATVLVIITGGLFGLLAGAAINYLADVLPVRRRLAQPRCVRCEAALPWGAYLMLRRCPACGAQRGLRPPLVLAAGIFGGVWMTLSPPLRLGSLAGGFWLAYMLLIVVIDIEHHLILHVVTGVGAIAALISGTNLHGLGPTLAGGLVGAGVMALFYLLGVVYSRWSSRRRGVAIEDGDAFGFGDVTLSGVIGLLLGWPGVIAGLVFAILLAGAISLIAIAPMLLRRRYNPNLALPYGPALAAATIYLLYLRTLFL